MYNPGDKIIVVNEGRKHEKEYSFPVGTILTVYSCSEPYIKTVEKNTNGYGLLRLSEVEPYKRRRMFNENA
jgi:hypothetical protein